MYGLRQSSTNWWNTTDEHLVEIGFKSFKSDPCVCTYSEGSDIIILNLMFYCLEKTTLYSGESSRS